MSPLFAVSVVCVAVTLLSLTTPACASAVAPAPSALAAAAVPVEVTRHVRQELSADGVVEAIRGATLSAQVAGRITGLKVAAGDAVRAGQVLLVLDGETVDRNLRAARQRWQAAAAALQVAQQDFEQYQALQDRQFVSRADLTRYEGVFKSALAEERARHADVEALETQLELFTLRAPFAGLIASLPVVAGDMAMPGLTLLTLYDPSALRVRIAVPESHALLFASASADAPAATIVMDIRGAGSLRPASVRVLPAVNPDSHTVDIELGLAAGAVAITPGMYVRVRYGGGAAEATEPALLGAHSTQFWVPRAAVVRRSELTGVYVLDASDQPLLRYVRLGRERGEQVEVLSGVRAGERVLTDPDMAFAGSAAE